MYKLRSLIIFFVLSITAIAQDNEIIVRSFVNKSYFRNANIGIFIKDLHSNKVVVNYGTDKFLIPASTQKLLTTYIALSTFGTGHRFKTSLAYNGQIKDSILYGDIIIKGFGDPTLGSDNFKENEFLQEFIRAISDLGIRNISGDIIADASYFDPTPTPRKWTWEDLGNYYGATPTALCIYDNTYELIFRTDAPGTNAHILRIEPKIPELNIISYVKAAYIHSDQSYIIGAPESFNRKIIGRLPAYRSEYRVKGAIPDPPLFLAQLLKSALDTSGIAVNGLARKLNAKEKYAKIVEFYTYFSPPLIDIIRKTNQNSINLYAEVLLKHLALYYRDTASTEVGISSVYDYLYSIGIDTAQILMYDGSGLSRYNVITPQAMAEFLEEVYHSRLFDDFLTSLPIAGHSGTLKYFGRGTILQNNFIAKSGSMKAVRNYAGYYFNKHGKAYVVVVMLNNFTCSQAMARKEIVRFLTQIFSNERDN